MAQIYIAFVDTPGFFAGMIRQVIKQKYIHHLFCGTFHFTRKTITPVLPTWHGY